MLGTAAGVAIDTMAYLAAWWAIPVWALAGAVVLQWWGRDRPLERWATSGRAARRLAGAFLLAVARPLGGSDVRRSLERLEGRPAAVALYLVAGHGLTVYYLVLLGPLLGKDVLLSHVLGMVAFAVFAGLGLRLVGAGTPSVPTSESASDDARSLVRIFVGEGRRFVGWSLWGLAVGGLVGAAGLTWPSLYLVDLLPGQGLVRQLVHGVVGLLAASLTFMGPVATLFAGTYLWKVGLAHAGLVAFFGAATLSPHRVRLYRKVWGVRRGVRTAMVLALAALLAGLAVAAVFGVTGLEIRYKLAPGQLWTP